MKKLYTVYLLLTIIPLCSSINAMEHASVETEKEEGEASAGFNLLSAELLEHVALYVASAPTIKQAYNNVQSFLQSLGRQGAALLHNTQFMKYVINNLYKRFINPIPKNKNMISYEQLGEAVSIAVSFENNAYAIERLNKWLADGGLNEKERQEYLTEYTYQEISANDSDANKRAQFLIEHMGVNVNSYDTNKISDKFYLLYDAAEEGNEEMVHYLVEHGADINAINHGHSTALLRAIQYNRTAVAYYLVEKGADVNIPDQSGTTPLMYAVMINNSNLVSRLLERGAQIDAIDIYQRTARDIAQQLNLNDIVTLLDNAEITTAK